jgi:Protein of unknown function (DUF3891)
VLVTRRHGELELLTQRDHAGIAGALTERWGGGGFEVPAAREALLCAATHHDDGWLELDRQPAYNPDAARPAHFTEVPLAESVGPYGQGVESVYARDPLAGALCSMHWSGFSTSRWGAGGIQASDDPLALQVVATQEARWMPALREAWGNRGRRSEFDAHAWHAYEILQAVDLLSLGLGLMDAETAGNGHEPVAVDASLSTVEQGASPRTIGNVPLAAGAGAGTVTLMLTALGHGRIELDPYPLVAEPAVIEIPIRRIPDHRYASAAEASSAYHSAGPQSRTVELLAPAR